MTCRTVRPVDWDAALRFQECVISLRDCLAGEFFGVNRSAAPAEVAQVAGHVIDHGYRAANVGLGIGGRNVAERRDQIVPIDPIRPARMGFSAVDMAIPT